MDITIFPGFLSGTIAAMASKSQAHRLLILAALADRPMTLYCPEISRDMEATARCLNTLGADISTNYQGFSVNPIQKISKTAILDCGESGSTLRFLLPLAGALGVDATFQMAGRLPQRPLSPLWEEMEAKGCTLSRPTPNTIRCQGRLIPGTYRLRGDVSSQFVTGLLLAFAVMEGPSTLELTSPLESKPYVDMTLAALERFFARIRAGEDRFQVTPAPLTAPERLWVEGDWSNAAFWLGAKSLGSTVDVTNLDPSSPQGDRAVVSILPRLGGDCVVDCRDIPDLVPILAVVAATKEGTTCFTGAARLRLKESDRIATVCNLVNALGGHARETADGLVVDGGAFTGGTVDAAGDHRIAMAAAIAATVCAAPVTVLGAECVTKSYPSFWEDYEKLGGRYEQHLR